MKHGVLMVLSLCALLTACEVPITSYDDAESLSIEEVQQPPLTFSSIGDIYRYIGKNTHYALDSEVHGEEEYWQSPYETYSLKTGDCEDWAIFVGYFAAKQGHTVSIVGANLVYGGHHALVRIDGTLMDGRCFTRFPANEIKSIDDEWSLEEALGICHDIYNSK